MNEFSKAEQQLIIDAARNDLMSYSLAINPNYVPNAFAESVASEIQDVFERKK